MACNRSRFTVADATAPAEAPRRQTEKTSRFRRRDIEPDLARGIRPGDESIRVGAAGIGQSCVVSKRTIAALQKEITINGRAIDVNVYVVESGEPKPNLTPSILAPEGKPALLLP